LPGSKKTNVRRIFSVALTVFVIVVLVGGFMVLLFTGPEKNSAAGSNINDESTPDPPPDQSPAPFIIEPANNQGGGIPGTDSGQKEPGDKTPADVNDPRSNNGADANTGTPGNSQPPETGANEPADASEPENKLPHFIDELSPRYDAYQELYPDMPFDLVVAYVNANVDKGSYVDVEIVSNPADIKLLLNQNFGLPSDYEPPDLVQTGSGWYLRSEAAGALAEMIEAGKKDGKTLVVMSGYRSRGSQAEGFNKLLQTNPREAVERNSARPGHSEHELGLAVDVLQRSGTGPFYYYYFEKSAEYKWLSENAHRFGFILRYPEEYSFIHRYVYEPWHWRYVGVETATTIWSEGITTLEEYYGRYVAPLA